ncbi:hypothetical protein F7725_026912 [Dissostichus mawsoni]|uniref:Uncharacterized protein n=1 Tax=Dissostichus mawsoni TaxID=36200 RepID=A0A7J5X9F3_DISMA|nr:hypothetical protein F7725_026912 [Dissostichus mawsoni]
MDTGNIMAISSKSAMTYRQLVRLCWGYLGRDIRVPLPSCAVNRIRRQFPSMDYHGYEEGQ